MEETHYKPFPPFTEWAKTEYDLDRWQRYGQKLENLENTKPEQHKKAIKIIGQIAAYHTGAIEDLYDIDRGITFTIATEAAMIEEALSTSDERTTDLVLSQLEVYEYILDWVTKKDPVNESWLRELHSQICAKQGTYRVMTTSGVFEDRDLPLGIYKALPNDVKTKAGNIHRYASPEETPAEMERLVLELRSEEFENAHPLLQASYAHYALVAVHPFADGNGRIARALASVYTYRSQSIPFLILHDDRDEYFTVLEKSDEGNYQPFIGFVSDCCFNAIILVVSSLSAAGKPDMNESVSAIKRLYLTKSGYTHDQIDDAAKEFMQLLHRSVNECIAQGIEGQDKISFGIQLLTGRANLPDQYRTLIDSGKSFQIMVIKVGTSAPADASVETRFYLAIPKGSGLKDDFVIFGQNQIDEILYARVDELLPQVKHSLSLRIKLFAENQCRTILTILRANAESRL